MGKGRSGRAKNKPFIMFEKEVIRSKEYADLSPKAVKLLIEVMEQYNGNNNGDLCITMSVMKKRGWSSTGTLQAAKDELIEKGWIELSRQGGRHKCSLYAVSFYPIDECGGKHDRLSTKQASNLWKGKITIPARESNQRAPQQHQSVNG